MDGIILIDKEEGVTSFDIVRRVKGLLKIKKVGHAGTLDPFATGLLILLLGQGTKISSYLMNENKVYLASIRLGMETDTLDSTGKIVQIKAVPSLSRETIEDGLSFFRGEINQKPPVYSALKFQGMRAYNLARRGIQFELKERRIKIFRIELLDVDLPRLTIRISCSGGTYIRSLASDIGKRLGTVGYLESLRRLSSGSYSVEDAYRFMGSWEKSQDQLQGRIIPMHKSLPGLKTIDIGGRLADKIRNGYQPGLEEVVGRAEGNAPGNTGGNNQVKGPIKLIHGFELIAIAKIHQPEEGQGEKLKLARVFPGPEQVLRESG